jgi:hypothetical protein
MSWVISINKGRGKPSLHSDWGAVDNEKDACVYATKEQAEGILELCGLYRILGWKAKVQSSRLAVSVPGPGSPISWDMPLKSVTAPASKAVKATKAKPPKPPKKLKPKQLSLFGD